MKIVGMISILISSIIILVGAIVYLFLTFPAISIAIIPLAFVVGMIYSRIVIDITDY